MNTSVDAFTILKLISELYDLNTVIIYCDDDIKTFVRKYKFHKIQNSISFENIKNYISEYGNEVVYVSDVFLIHFMIITIQQQAIIIGPFSSVALNSNDVRTIFIQNDIHDLSVKDFFSYFNAFPVLAEQQALHIIDSIFNTFNIYETIMVRRINSKVLSSIYNTLEDVKRDSDIQLVEKRYACEQKFIVDIQNGNARSAIMDLRNMQADVKYLKKLGTTLEYERIGAAITRTTIRIAAMNAHLPIYIINQLSKENTLTTLNAKNVDEILESKEKMIRDFCTAIQKNNSDQHSATVQTIMYYFEKNYFQDITLEQLSKELDLSSKHIISTFKKETGETPMCYLRKLRIKQASLLLSGSNMSIQDISSSVGIPDANYFIKLFKKEYNLTPLAYRKKFR